MYFLGKCVCFLSLLPFGSNGKEVQGLNWSLIISKWIKRGLHEKRLCDEHNNVNFLIVTLVNNLRKCLKAWLWTWFYDLVLFSCGVIFLVNIDGKYYNETCDKLLRQGLCWRALFCQVLTGECYYEEVFIGQCYYVEVIDDSVIM